MKLIRREQHFGFKWPNGWLERFDFAEHYELPGYLEVPCMVAYGWRPAFGHNRRRVIVFLARTLWPAVEFVGADHYASDKVVLWPLKKPGGNSQYTLREEPHDDFGAFQPVPFKNHIQGKNAFKGWAVALREGQADKMTRLGLIRARHRGWPGFVPERLSGLYSRPIARTESEQESRCLRG